MKKNPIKFTAKILIVASGLLITFCSPPKDVEKTTFISKQTLDLEDSATTNKKEGDAHGGKYFSRADSGNIYGCGTVINIPDSLQQKDLRIKLNGWVRIGDLGADKKYAFSLEEPSGNMLNWSQIDFRSHVSETNTWVNVIDSVTIPGNLITKSGLIIKAYSFNPDGKSNLDCDDVELSFFKVEKTKGE